MPYMLRRRITTDSDLDASGTWRYRLPRIGKFTAIELVVAANRLANRSAIQTVIPLEQECTKIELLEGGTRPLVSLTGEQLDAMNYWDNKVPNARRYRQLADRDNLMVFYLMGGRSLWDREYGWDMAKLGETYIEFSHDMTADVTHGFDASSAAVEVYAHQWMGDGLPEFTKYFRSRQLAYWATTGSSIIKTIPIPVGNPVRRVAFQAGTRASTLGGTATELELVANDGEYTPVHIKSLMRYVMQEVSEYGLENEVGGVDYLYCDSGHDLPYWFSYYQGGNVSGYASVAVQPEIMSLIQIPATVAGVAGTYQEVVFRVRGWGFQKALRIGFDHEDDGFDLLQTQGLGALDLIVTEAAASKDARVFVQDVLSY